jgi:hypothetical protein
MERIPILLVRYEDLLSNEEVPSPSLPPSLPLPFSSLTWLVTSGLHENDLRISDGGQASRWADSVTLALATQ